MTVAVNYDPARNEMLEIAADDAIIHPTYRQAAEALEADGRDVSTNAPWANDMALVEVPIDFQGLVSTPCPSTLTIAPSAENATRAAPSTFCC